MSYIATGPGVIIGPGSDRNIISDLGWGEANWLPCCLASDQKLSLTMALSWGKLTVGYITETIYDYIVSDIMTMVSSHFN